MAKRVSYLGAGLLSVLVLAGAPSALAAPTWLAPRSLISAPVTKIQSDPFFNRKSLDVGSDSAGNSIAVWVEENPKVPGPGAECRAMQATRPAGGSFDAPQPLGPAMAFCSGQIKLAMNAGGTAVVAWRQGGEIDASIRQSGGSFSAPVRLDSTNSNDDPWVSINDSGVAAVTWDDTAVSGCAGLTSGANWAFHAVIFHPGIGFGGVETVCDAPHPSGPTIFTPRSAVDPQGDVVATWVNSYNDGTNSHVAVESAFRPASGSFNGATPQVLVDNLNPIAPAGSFAADIAVDSQGRATAVWPHFSGAHTVIDTAVRPPGDSSAFSSGGSISDSAADSGSPRLAVDPSTNTAVAAWVQCSSGSCQVEGSTRPSGGGFQSPQALSGPGATTTFGPLVAFDPSGAAAAIWSGPSPDTAGTQVQVTRRPPGPGMSFGAVRTISTDDPSQSPALAFDGEGNAVAIWAHDIASPPGVTIEYAGLDAAPPEIQAVSAPNGTAGQQLFFTAGVFDRWSNSTVTWSFGDGKAASGASTSYIYPAPGTYTVTVKAVDSVGNESQQTRTVQIAAAKKHKKCKRGFHKKRVRGKRKGKGKTRCVRVKHHHHHHHHKKKGQN